MSGRLDRTRRKSIKALIPSLRCTATSSQTGEPCRAWAVVGASVCQDHGGASPRTRAKADRHVALAEALASGLPGRSAAAVLLDSMNTLDRIAQDVKLTATRAGNPIPPDLLGQLVEATKTSATMAKIVADLGIDAHGVQRDQAAAMGYVLRLAGASLGLKLSERRVSRAVGAALRELEAAGPDVAERAHTIERDAARLAAERDAAAQAERELRAAELDRERDAIRGRFMIELRHRARQAACEVCATPPAAQGQAQSPPRELESGHWSPSEGGRYLTSQRGSQSDLAGRDEGDEADPFDLSDEVLTGELIEPQRRRGDGPRAITATVVCPGCLGDRGDPEHDRRCGYVTASTDPGRGRPWIP